MGQLLQFVRAREPTPATDIVTNTATNFVTINLRTSEIATGR